MLVTIKPKAGNEVSGAFSEVTGLSTEVTYAEYREGTDPTNAPRKIPLMYKVGDITLKRGLIGGLDLWKWIELVRAGNNSAPKSPRGTAAEPAQVPNATCTI